MENLKYSKEMDLVEGYEDLGHLGRTEKTAKYSLVFMIRGLYFTWKLPIAYFLSHTGVKGETLAKLIKDVISRLQKCNVLIKCIVCDQGSGNRSAMKFLGVSHQHPHFFVENTKIFGIYDTPHLIKSVRNNLLTGDFLIENNVVSFDNVRKVYEIDVKNQKSRALVKLTNTHINPNTFQKMNVKLAVQVLSHTVAAAIRTAAQTGELTGSSAETTADFIDFINNLFDCLNSRTITSKNPYNSALIENSVVQNTLKDALEFLPKVVKIDRSTQRFSKPPCFTGLIQTVRGVLSLFEEEKSNNIKFILTFPKIYFPFTVRKEATTVIPLQVYSVWPFVAMQLIL